MNEIVKIILSVHLCFLVLCLALYIDQHDTTIWFHVGYYYIGFWTGIVIYFMGTEAQKRMCKEYQTRNRTYEWIRDRNGDPKKMHVGGYVMQNENDACFVFDVETIDKVKALLDEIKELEE